MACVGAGAFGLLYLVETIITKKWKHFYIALFWGLLTILSLYIQWHNPIIPEYSHSYSFLENLKTTTHCNKSFINITGIASLYFISCMYFRKNKLPLFYITFCWASLIIIFTQIYCGWYWHHWFFYIYLIIAYWLNEENCNCMTSIKKIFACVFCIFSILSTYYLFNTHTNRTWDIAPITLKKALPPNSTIYVSDVYNNIDLITYSRDFNLKNYKGEKLITLQNFRYIYNHRPQVFDLQDLMQKATKNSYLLIDLNEFKNIKDNSDINIKNRLVLTINKTLCGDKTYLLFHLK